MKEKKDDFRSCTFNQRTLIRKLINEVIGVHISFYIQTWKVVTGAYVS